MTTYVNLTRPPAQPPPFQAAGPMFPNVAWCQLLPDTTPVDATSTAGIARVVTFLSRGIWANRQTWSARLVDVVKSQARYLPVIKDRNFDGVDDNVTGYGIEPCWKTFGVPFPADGPPPPQDDSDSALVIRAWDDTRTTVLELHEIWGYRVAADGAIWGAHGGRKINPGADTHGHYIQSGWVTNGVPNWYGYESSDMGVTAVGIPLPLGWITQPDIDRGYCDHPIGIAFPPGADVVQWWPAQRHDSASDTALRQGARWRLPAGTQPPPGCDPLLACIIRTTAQHGMFLWDTNLGTLPTVRVVGTTQANGGIPGAGAFGWSACTLLPETYLKP